MPPVIDKLRGACGLNDDCADAADAAQNLACDHCRYWGNRNRSETAVCLHPEDLVTRNVPGDFFCAYWESKR